MQTEIELQLAVEMLENIRVAFDAHADECEREPKAILLHPGNHDLIGWDEVLGLPVLPDERVEPKQFLLVCGMGRGGYCAQGDVYWDENGHPYIVEPEPA